MIRGNPDGTQDVEIREPLVRSSDPRVTDEDVDPFSPGNRRDWVYVRCDRCGVFEEFCKCPPRAEIRDDDGDPD